MTVPQAPHPCDLLDVGDPWSAVGIKVAPDFQRAVHGLRWGIEHQTCGIQHAFDIWVGNSGRQRIGTFDRFIRGGIELMRILDLPAGHAHILRFEVMRMVQATHPVTVQIIPVEGLLFCQDAQLHQGMDSGNVSALHAPVALGMQKGLDRGQCWR